MARRPSRRLKESAPSTPSFAPRLFNRHGVAYYISASPSYVDALVLQGVLKPIPLPATRGSGTTRVPLFDKNDVDLLIEKLKAAGGAQ